MQVSIVKPKMEHASAIAGICSTGWMQTVEGKLSKAYQLANIEFWYNPERIQQDIEKGIYSHIACIGNKVAGVIGGGMTAPTTGEVFVLYMDEKSRYQGIGRQLLEALTKEQKENGAIEQWVSVQEGNHLGIPFYEARGFEYRGKNTELTDTGEQQVSLRYCRSI